MSVPEPISGNVNKPLAVGGSSYRVARIVVLFVEN